METALEHGELITHIHLPIVSLARRSHYLKVRDRASYEFALASAAVAVTTEGGVIAEARVGLGGIATRPWRSLEAETALIGQPASDATFLAAANAALAGARPQQHNAFKIGLAKETLMIALQQVTKGNN
jgi:xanthine dehydrogenase YagS FAD-binding subunit